MKVWTQMEVWEWSYDVIKTRDTNKNFYFVYIPARLILDIHQATSWGASWDAFWRRSISWSFSFNSFIFKKAEPFRLIVISVSRVCPDFWMAVYVKQTPSNTHTLTYMTMDDESRVSMTSGGRDADIQRDLPFHLCWWNRKSVSVCSFTGNYYVFFFGFSVLLLILPMLNLWISLLDDTAPSGLVIVPPNK